jgi:hypothetical protein
MVYTMIVMVYTMVYIYGTMMYHDLYHLPILYIPWYIPKVVYTTFGQGQWGGIYHEATSGFQMTSCESGPWLAEPGPEVSESNSPGPIFQVPGPT